MYYIVAVPTTLLGIMAFLILILIRILSNAAVEYDIKQELFRDLRYNAKYVCVKDEELEIAEDFEFQNDKVFFLVLNKTGDVLAGSYPVEGFPKIPVNNGVSKRINCAGAEYYVRDRTVGWTKSDRYYLRAVVNKEDTYSRYQTIELVSYLTVAGVFCGILIIEFFVGRWILGHLKSMCENAEHIGSNLDMSQRMSCENPFSELAVLAQANNRMLDRMEQTFQQQEQFTSDVAHELRTPIAVTLAQCQYARNRMENKEDFLDALEVIGRQANKINTIITQLLSFSRLEQGRMQLGQENLDFAEIVPSVCEDCQEKSGGRVSIKMKLQEVCATGDIALISIVIQNLITNAIKFSHDFGVVEVETGEHGEWVYVAVQDYGIGIEQEEQERIFQRFYKCDKSRNKEGFGLGLSLSMKIAQKHGGTITVSSQAGEGSRFTLWLPKNQ